MAANVQLLWHSELLAAFTKYNSLDNLNDIFYLESLLCKQFEGKYNSAMVSTRILLTLPKITKHGDTRFVQWRHEPYFSLIGWPTLNWVATDDEF